MPKLVSIPNIGEVEFPDEVDESQILETLRTDYPDVFKDSGPQTPPQDLTEMPLEDLMQLEVAPSKPAAPADLTQMPIEDLMNVEFAPAPQTPQPDIAERAGMELLSASQERAAPIQLDDDILADLMPETRSLSNTTIPGDVSVGLDEIDPATGEFFQRESKRKGIEEEQKGLREGKPFIEGGALKQVGIQSKQIMPTIGGTAYGAIEQATTPTEVPLTGKSFRPAAAALEATPGLGMTINALKKVPGLEGVISKGVDKAFEFVRGTAEYAGAKKWKDVAAVQTEVEATKGAKLPGEAVKTAAVSAPFVMAGQPAGIIGMSAGAAAQQIGASFQETVKEWEKQLGDTPEAKDQAKSLAVQQTMLTGTIVGLTTYLFGKTGAEAFGKSLVGEALEQATVAGINRQAMGAQLARIMTGGAKEMGLEVPEEVIQQASEDLIAMMTSNPDMTWAEFGQNVVKAGVLAPTAAGVMVTPTAITEAGAAVVGEKARKEALQQERAMGVREGRLVPEGGKMRPGEKVQIDIPEADLTRAEKPFVYKPKKPGEGPPKVPEQKPVEEVGGARRKAVLTPEARRQLEDQAQAQIDIIENPDERDRVQNKLDNLKKERQLVQKELDEAKTEGDKQEAISELLAIQNRIRKLAGLKEEAVPGTEEPRDLTEEEKKAVTEEEAKSLMQQLGLRSERGDEPVIDKTGKTPLLRFEDPLTDTSFPVRIGMTVKEVSDKLEESRLKFSKSEAAGYDPYTERGGTERRYFVFKDEDGVWKRRYVEKKGEKWVESSIEQPGATPPERQVPTKPADIRKYSVEISNALGLTLPRGRTEARVVKNRFYLWDPVMGTEVSFTAEQSPDDMEKDLEARREAFSKTGPHKRPFGPDFNIVKSAKGEWTRVDVEPAKPKEKPKEKELSPFERGQKRYTFLRDQEKLNKARAAELRGLAENFLPREYNDRAKELEPSDVGTKEERNSELSPEIVVQAREDLTRRKTLFVRVSDALVGLLSNTESAVDKIVKGEDGWVAPNELYDAFEATRQMLRKQFGDTITLYRASDRQTGQATTNWATTKALAKKYGDNIVSEQVPIDNIVAVDVGLDGKSEQIIVGKPPVDPLSVKDLGIKKHKDHKLTGEWVVTYPNGSTVSLLFQGSPKGWISPNHPRGLRANKMGTVGPLVIGKDLDAAKQWLASNPLQEGQGTPPPARKSPDALFEENELEAITDAIRAVQVKTPSAKGTILDESGFKTLVLSGPTLIRAIRKQARVLKHLLQIQELLDSGAAPLPQAMRLTKLDKMYVAELKRRIGKQKNPAKPLGKLIDKVRGDLESIFKQLDVPFVTMTAGTLPVVPVKKKTGRKPKQKVEPSPVSFEAATPKAHAIPVKEHTSKRKHGQENDFQLFYKGKGKNRTPVYISAPSQAGPQERALGIKHERVHAALMLGEITLPNSDQFQFWLKGKPTPMGRVNSVIDKLRKHVKDNNLTDPVLAPDGVFRSSASDYLNSQAEFVAQLVSSNLGEWLTGIGEFDNAMRFVPEALASDLTTQKKGGESVEDEQDELRESREGPREEETQDAQRPEAKKQLPKKLKPESKEGKYSLATILDRVKASIKAGGFRSDWMVTVTGAQTEIVGDRTYTMPASVQLDLMKVNSDGEVENVKSGVGKGEPNVPDFTVLPQGKYTYPEAMELLGEKQPNKGVDAYREKLTEWDNQIKAIEDQLQGSKEYIAEIKKQAEALGVEVKDRDIEDVRIDVFSAIETQKHDELANLAYKLNVDLDTAWERVNNFDVADEVETGKLGDNIEDIPVDAPDPMEPPKIPKTLWDLTDDQLEALASGAFEVLEDRRGLYTFETYDKFKEYMDARYAERDFAGMDLAFKEAEGQWKAKYARENSDASEHKRSWITTLFTPGIPLPENDPPVERTTPRPTASGEPDPGPRRPQAPQPPRTPREDMPTEQGDSPYEKFNVMALVQFLKFFGNEPTTQKRLGQAWGHYVYRMRDAKGDKGEILPFMNQIELLAELFSNSRLALRVLSHEIGHFIDLGTRPEGRNIKNNKTREFWQKFKGLNLLAEDLGPLKGTATDAQTQARATLLEQAKSLSAEWRGPFPATSKYRNDPRELFADYMSAMLVNPGFVKDNYPYLEKHFKTLLENKPEFRRAYELMTEFISSDTLDQRVENQMDQAVEDTMGKVTQERKKEKRSWFAVLRGAFITKYGRARDVEKAKGIGDTLVDLVELSHTWGMTQDSLTADTLNKDMIPWIQKLAGVKADVLQTARNILSGRAPRYSAAQQRAMEGAMKELHKYNVWSRIVWERRASGKWIEQNGPEARELLESILAVVQPLNARWKSKLDNAPDSGLYDLAAMIFLDINANEWTKTIAQFIDGLDLDVKGEAILTAFNVRGKLLNPEGITEADAVRLLKKQKERLSDDEYEALRKASGVLKRVLYETQLKAYREGLINPVVWDEIIKNNAASYVPFSVFDSFEGTVPAGVLPQKGTAKPLADTTIAAQLKISSLNRWRQRQRQVTLLKQMYEKNGGKVVVKKLKKANEIHAIRQKFKGDDISRGVYYQRGKPYLIEFHNDKGKELQQAMDDQNAFAHMEVVSEMGDLAHQVMQLYTSFTSSFMFVSNPIRGFRTAAQRVGILNMLKVSNPFSSKLYNAIALAFNYAQAAKGGIMDPFIREMVESEVLASPRMAGNMLRDVENMTDMMAAGTAYVNQLHRLGGEVKRPAKTKLGKAWRAMTWLPGQVGRFTAMPALRRLQWFFTMYEGFEKIQTYKAAQMKWADKKGLVEGLARRGGIPKPGVGGYWSMPMEFFVPWLRVSLQGLRATLELLKDSNTRSGFATRLFLMEGAPRLWRYALATGMTVGVLRFLLNDDEDPEDTVMAEVMRRLSPYKLATQDVIPIWFYDPRTGEYDLIATSDYRSGSEIPEHLEIVSWRIPASEEGRTFGPLMWNMLVQMSPNKEQMERPGTTPLQEFYRWSTNYLLPGFSPVLETGKGLSDMLIKGENPDDPYTGYPAANPQFFDAGWGNGREQAIMGYLANQLGGPGYLGGQLAAMSGLVSRDVLKTLKLRDFTEKKDPWYMKDPTGTMRALVSHDNYARFRERKLKGIEEKQLRAMTKQIMPPQVKDMYEFYWKNRDRVDQMDPADYGKFRAAGQFVSKVWGKLDDPDSYYNKAAYAMTSGSKQNKETVTRDLLFAAEPWIALYSNPEAVRITTVLHLSDAKTAKANLSPAAHMVYDRRREEVQANYYDRLRNDPRWSGLDQEMQRKLKLEANQLAREHAAKYLIQNPQLWRK